MKEVKAKYEEGKIENEKLSGANMQQKGKNINNKLNVLSLKAEAFFTTTIAMIITNFNTRPFNVQEN